MYGYVDSLEDHHELKTKYVVYEATTQTYRFG